MQGNCVYNAAIILLFVFNTSLGQKSLNLSMNYPPGSGNFRNYSIYEPAGFNLSKANKLIIGFHPYGPGSWNSNSWRDTLRPFIDLAKTLLVCPDGGAGGLTDETEDYEFTDALLESIRSTYLIDSSKIFVLGFSIGGKAAYEYGLSRDSNIAGVIPIGASIDGIDFSDIISGARCRPFYIIHGDKDKPNSRYFPMKADLISNGGLVDGILLANVGHTINFPQRNSILKMAFNYVDTSSCDYTDIRESKASIMPDDVNVELSGDELLVNTDQVGKGLLSVYSHTGQIVFGPQEINKECGLTVIETSSWKGGLYIVSHISTGMAKSKKILIY